MEAQTGVDEECTPVDELLDNFNQEVEDMTTEKRKTVEKKE